MKRDDTAGTPFRERAAGRRGTGVLRRIGRPSDERLIARAACGDSGAAGELYDRYGQVSYGLALRILRVPRLAEAAVEDAFGAIGRIDGQPIALERSARASILALVHRRAVELLRARDGQADSARTGAVPDRETGNPVGDGLGAERARTRRALDRLPDEQREPLLLAYLDGLSVGELAARLGRPSQAIEEGLRAGLQGFREGLEEQAAPRREPAPRAAADATVGSELPFAFGDGDVDQGQRV